MENLIKHWASHPRLFPSQFPIQSIGYAAKGTDGWIDTEFSTLNFSLILKGGGEYHSNGVSLKVKAPCVIMQFPGVHCSYGPDMKNGSWDELYFIYNASTFEGFKAMRLLDENRPVWPIHSTEWIENRLAKINSQLSLRRKHGQADWLDRAIQSLLLDGLLALAPPEMTDEEKTIQKARRWLQQNIDQTVNWEQLSTDQGMSLPTFRRHWNRYIQDPPAKYLSKIRIQEARRLLVESNDPISRVAAKVGIEDPLYFSRLFRSEMGTSPRDYRETFRWRAGRQEDLQSIGAKDASRKCRARFPQGARAANRTRALKKPVLQHGTSRS